MEKQHGSRGRGEGSRLSFDIEKLQSLGWKVKRRESTSSGKNKVHLTYKAPDGRTLKSARDVEKELRDSGLYSQVAVKVVEASQEPGTSSSTFDDRDPDFHLPAAKLQKTTKLEKSVCDTG